MGAALKAAKQGSHLFIEKPISHNLKDINKLYSITKSKNKQCFVAFNYRFHPNLLKMEKEEMIMRSNPPMISNR